MFREILPNMASLVMITLLGTVIFGIGAQAGLEFLGLGDPGVISWGTNLYWANNDGALLSGYWWAFVPSGMCIALVAFALALVNYGVDEVSNPRLRTARRRRAKPSWRQHDEHQTAATKHEGRRSRGEDCASSTRARAAPCVRWTGSRSASELERSSGSPGSPGAGRPPQPTPSCGSCATRRHHGGSIRFKGPMSLP